MMSKFKRFLLNVLKVLLNILPMVTTFLEKKIQKHIDKIEYPIKDAKPKEKKD